MRNQLILFGLILLVPLPIFAQFPPVCASANVPLAKTCAQACVVCDLDGFSSATTQGIPGQAPPDFCTQVVHSMGWIGFVAGSTNLSIQVNVGACTQGNAIEMGMYKSEGCQTFSMVSDCNTFMPQNNSFVFSNTEPLVPGCHYYLVFDNNGPAACPFTVSVLSGSAKAPILQPPPAPVGPKLVCPNTEHTYSLEPVFGACLYEITAPSGVLINGKPSPITLKSNELNDIVVKWGNTGGKICIRGRNACNSSPFSCIDVAIKTIAPTLLPPVTICAGQGYEWVDGNIYFSSVNLTYTYTTAEGCDSTILRKLNVRPPILTNLGNFDLCTGQSITVNGKQYMQQGFYTLTLTTATGCDSNVTFLINTLPVPMLSLYADSLCQDSIAKLIATFAPPNSAIVWTGPKGFNSTQADTSTRKPGLYTCTATHPTSGCSTTLSINVASCCITFAGTLDTASIRLCGPKPLSIPHKNDEKLDTNDRLIFLLFTNKNNPWGSAIGFTNEREIPFLNNLIQWNTTYYVMAVAADSMSTGVDTNSVCYNESACMKVIWHRKPMVQQVEPQAAVCKDGCTDLAFDFSGLPPFNYTLLVEQLGQTLLRFV
jgi:PKD-like domain